MDGVGGNSERCLEWGGCGAIKESLLKLLKRGEGRNCS